MLIFVIPRTKNQSITVKGNNIALGFATASSQEGSGIAKRIPQGVVPITKQFGLGTTPRMISCWLRPIGLALAPS
jgi:hypothetical protein